MHIERGQTINVLDENAFCSNLNQCPIFFKVFDFNFESFNSR